MHLAFQGGPCGSKGAYAYLAAAPSWDGTYKLVSDGVITDKGGIHPFCVAGQDEDPFLWRTARGFHLLTHGMCPSGLRQAHYKYSRDGVEWNASPWQTYHYTVSYSDRLPHVFARMERPQLAFAERDEETGFVSKPIALFNGVCGDGSRGSNFECVFDQLTGKTWTLVRELE